MVVAPGHAQTLPGRLSILEQAYDWLKDKVPTSTDLTDAEKALYTITYTGANTNPLEADPWASALIYSTGHSLHNTVFGTTTSTATATQYQDGHGLSGWIFRLGETRWGGGSNSDSGTTFSTDVFGELSDAFVHALRTSSYHNLATSVWGTTTNISVFQADGKSIADEIISIKTDIVAIKSDIADIEADISSIKARLAAGGL